MSTGQLNAAPPRSRQPKTTSSESRCKGVSCTGSARPMRRDDGRTHHSDTVGRLRLYRRDGIAVHADVRLASDQQLVRYPGQYTARGCRGRLLHSADSWRQRHRKQHTATDRSVNKLSVCTQMPVETRVRGNASPLNS